METPELITIAYYAGFVSVLVSLPLVCLMDLKYRELPNWVWCSMLGINIPFVYILYTNGLPITYLMLSLVIIGIYLLLWGMKWIGGADAKFLAAIALITPITPFSYQPFQISFYMCLSIVLGVLPLVIYTYNYLKREQKSIVRMFIEVPRGVPYMIPISVAFVMALIYGAIV